ncbi:MAG: type ISP restriction/modification enzyme [Bradymonadales bacterium]
MNTELKQYLANINSLYITARATEHSYRAELQNLMQALLPGILITSEPKRQACGAPDYILSKNDLPLAFVETKDIDDDDLDGRRKSGNKEQFDRYKKSLDKVIFTDYLRFYFYKNAKCVAKISIGEIKKHKIHALKENFSKFKAQLQDFTQDHSQSIKNSIQLAELMAAKTRFLANAIENALHQDEAEQENSTLQSQLRAFQHYLNHDISPKTFADVYAQTIVYGLFAARLHAPTLNTFSRQEAYCLIPKSNPFLKQLFAYIAGLELNERIKWIVNDLLRIFRVCDLQEMLQDYAKSRASEDPIIHFYEDFLTFYDAKLRKSRGVWYTPKPIVNFMVRAVDSILMDDFGLNLGLADNSRIDVKVDVQGKEIKKSTHRVQILDPATGTGAFLAEIIKEVHKKFVGQESIWSSYVEEELLPRLNGFEILMASYAMAHLNLDLLLQETGFVPTQNQRLRVFLCNSLEEYHKDTGTLFSTWLSNEAKEANCLKRDCPVMCVMGNPPYAVSSSNKGDWIQDLTADYKKDLNERKINLDDDYIKFIRYGQYLIDKNNSGVLAYVSNHSFLDGITHRRMRQSLLESFDKIYIIDLHGNSRKKETCPDGSVDENVFDIKQGVSINIFVKSKKKKAKTLSKVYHAELYGKREYKYEFLSSKELSMVNFTQLMPMPDNYFFEPKDFSKEKAYMSGFAIHELFINYSSGIETQKDSVAIQFNRAEMLAVIDDFLKLEVNEIHQKYNIKDGRDWKIDWAKRDVMHFNKDNIHKIQYRPFDYRYTYFSALTKGFIAYPRYEIMKHILQDNIALIAKRGFAPDNSTPCFITMHMVDRRMWTCSGMQGAESVFPLYIYSDTSTHYYKIERKPNFNSEIVRNISQKLKLPFSPEKEEDRNSFAPLDLLDYIYAVLHSPTYRQSYKEFLKIDFPRLPYPSDTKIFWALVDLGSKLRRLHLMETSALSPIKSRYPVAGSNRVDKKIRFIAEPKNTHGRVYINDTQYFDLVSKVAWNFYIGGYQPAQKWLKDRRDRSLSFDEIQHYQKILLAFDETAVLKQKIDSLCVDLSHTH